MKEEQEYIEIIIACMIAILTTAMMSVVAYYIAQLIN